MAPAWPRPLAFAQPAPGNPERTPSRRRHRISRAADRLLNAKRRDGKRRASFNFMCSPYARAVSRSIRADRPAPARAPVTAAHNRRNEAIAVTPAPTIAASATTGPATTAAAPTAASTATTSTTTGLRRRGGRGGYEQRRADEADGIDQDQSQRRQAALEEVRMCRVLGHMKESPVQRSALAPLCICRIRPASRSGSFSNR